MDNDEEQLHDGSSSIEQSCEEIKQRIFIILRENGYESLENRELIDARKTTHHQHIAAAAAAFSAVCAGLVLGWTSPITSQMEDGKFNNISISDEEMGWIGSIVNLGAMSMCYPFGLFCDLIGRRLALLTLLFPFIVGWSLIARAHSLIMLYIGRFLTGMAVGACCVGAPLYASEIAQKEIRGKVGSYFQLMVTIGILLAYILGKFNDNAVDYTKTCIIFPFVFATIFYFQPESPMYNLRKGRIWEAARDLVGLRGNGLDISAVVQEFKSCLVDENVSLWQSLKSKAAIKAFIIALTLMFFQQMSGINAIIFYTSSIFTDFGTKLDPQWAAIIVGTIQVISTIISTTVIEKLGRRPLLILSSLLMGVSILILGIFLSLKERQLVSTNALNALGFLPVLLLCLFVFMFSLGLGPIPWAISVDIFRPKLKSFAAASAGTFNWFLAFLVTKFYLELSNLIGSDVMFYLFSLICFCGALFCYFVVPETKGKTVEEIEVELLN